MKDSLLWMNISDGRLVMSFFEGSFLLYRTLLILTFFYWSRLYKWYFFSKLYNSNDLKGWVLYSTHQKVNMLLIFALYALFAHLSELYNLNISNKLTLKTYIKKSLKLYSCESAFQLYLSNHFLFSLVFCSALRSKYNCCLADFWCWSRRNLPNDQLYASILGCGHVWLGPDFWRPECRLYCLIHCCITQKKAHFDASFIKARINKCKFSAAEVGSDNVE